MKPRHDDIANLYRLGKLKGIGTVRANKHLFVSISSYGKDKTLEELPKMIGNVDEGDDWCLPQKTQQGIPIDYASVLDEDYPKFMIDSLSYNSPTVLSWAGNKDLLNAKCVAFCGARNVSEKGLLITSECIEQLAMDQCICIVSGYAKGVDRAAHYAALKNGLSTIIVLPEGISGFVVRKELADVWDWNRVLVLSPYAPNEKWSVANAMKRNDIIIALSNVVVVVEAGETGGSFDAGMKTIKKGKSLFVPQYASSPISAIGNSSLIEQGAIPIRMTASTRKPNITRMRESLTYGTHLFSL